MDFHHSIEELFRNIIRYLPSEVDHDSYVMRWKSKGLAGRLLNALDAALHQSRVNHITGDVHYISYFMRKKRTILTIHDLAPLSRGSQWKRKVIRFFWFTLPAKRVRYITVISEFIRKEFLEHIRTDPDKVRVVYDCISTAIEADPRPFNSDRPVILHVGTMPNKNLERVIQAVSGLDVRLIILGKLQPHHTHLLTEHHIDYENHFNLPYEEVLALYRRADILEFVSLYEGFGLPILEAQAIGRPVITSNICSMPEVAGDSALLVNPGDLQQIRDGLIRLLHDRNLREELIQKGYENVKRFHPSRIAQIYTELYRTIG